MRPIRFLVALAALAPLLAWTAGCGRVTDKEFTSYENLKTAPTDPQNDATRTAADQTADTSGNADTSDNADPSVALPAPPASAKTDASPNEFPPATPSAPIIDEPAVAEIPVELLLAAGNAASSSAEPNAAAFDEPAIAEGPEDVSITAASPRRVELLVPTKEFKKEGGALRITYDDFDLLKVLNMEPVTADAADLMPSWLKELDGQRVRVRGFMYPTTEATGLTSFVLARDNEICCFGRDPKIYDLVGVTMKEGAETDYIQGRPFDVIGVFRIRPRPDRKIKDRLSQLYLLDDAVVIERGVK